MSINKLISIKVPIINALDMLALDHTKYMPVFMTWAEEAEKMIGAYRGYVRKRIVLDITNCYACLPNDAMILERAILGDHGCDCDDLFYQCLNWTNNTFATGETSSFLVVDFNSSESTYFGGLIDYEIQNNKLIFRSSNYDGQKVTVQYRGQQVDCNGFMEISENHSSAIREWLEYNWAKKEWKKGKIGESQVQFSYREAGRLMREARAEDGRPTETESLKIVNMMHNAYSGIGLSVKMNTPLTNGTY